MDYFLISKKVLHKSPYPSVERWTRMAEVRAEFASAGYYGRIRWSYQHSLYGPILTGFAVPE